MTQYQSSMFSDAVYLFGNTFCLPPLKDDSEELPNGTKVNQAELAAWVVLAAFAYLYKEKLIDFVLEERESWFRKIKTVKVKKLQATASDLSGLELVLFSSLPNKNDMYGLTRGLIGGWFSSSNPWRDVVHIVQWNLLRRGIVKQVVKGELLFIKTYKYVENADVSKETKQLAELQKTLEELQSKRELYEQMLSDIEQGILSRLDTG